MNDHVLPKLDSLTVKQFAESLERWECSQGHRLATGKQATQLSFPVSPPLTYNLPDSEADSFDEDGL